MAEPLPASSVPPAEVSGSLVLYTNIIYGLHALTVVIAVVGSAGIGSVFVEGFPSVIAVIMNYARRSAVRGTLLESHFRWQIRTFWYAVLAGIVIGGGSFLLLWVGVTTFVVALLGLGVWIIYRVVRGWFSLRDRRAMYS